MAQKFYVVWSGRQTGVFSDWPTVQRAVEKYSGACFKSFSTRAEAERAFASGNSAVGSSNGAIRGRERRAPHIAHRSATTIYCDGACDPNPGNAGSGIVVYRGGRLAELWYGLYNPVGTNNTAELNALYHALRMAEAETNSGKTVQVCSDSAYSLNCVRTWAPSWEKRGWQKSGGEIKNLEVIKNCYAIYRRIKQQLVLTHIPGHAGIEGNELADRMAMFAARSKEKTLRRFTKTADIPTLLKMRAG